MGRTIGELMDTMSSQEFSIWMELYKDDQWGEASDDFRAGLICSTVANFAGKSLKDKSPPLKPSDFMPRFSDKPVEAEPDPVTFFQSVSASKTFNK